jgi:hypothetical protein
VIVVEAQIGTIYTRTDAERSASESCQVLRIFAFARAAPTTRPGVPSRLPKLEYLDPAR